MAVLPMFHLWAQRQNAMPVIVVTNGQSDHFERSGERVRRSRSRRRLERGTDHSRQRALSNFPFASLVAEERLGKYSVTKVTALHLTIWWQVFGCRLRSLDRSAQGRCWQGVKRPFVCLCIICSFRVNFRSQQKLHSRNLWVPQSPAAPIPQPAAAEEARGGQRSSLDQMDVWSHRHTGYFRAVMPQSR